MTYPRAAILLGVTLAALGLILAINSLRAVLCVLPARRNAGNASIPQHNVRHRPENSSMRLRPNFLLAVADDWGLASGTFGDSLAHTPTIDRLAREGLAFERAFCAAPTCTASRGAMLTGRWPWRLREGFNLWPVWHRAPPSFMELLAETGYATGRSGKGWGPGQLAGKARGGHAYGGPARTAYYGRSNTFDAPRSDSLAAFLDEREKATRRFLSFLRGRRPAPRPFAFWLGDMNTHRVLRHHPPGQIFRECAPTPGAPPPLRADQLSAAVPPWLPDSAHLRADLQRYYACVRAFDEQVNESVATLARARELERTIVIVTSDHGADFPRAKGSLYDAGTRVGLVLRAGSLVQRAWGLAPAGTRTHALVSTIDLFPTLLSFSGAPAASTKHLDGRSLLPVLQGTASKTRMFVLSGLERHSLTAHTAVMYWATLPAPCAHRHTCMCATCVRTARRTYSAMHPQHTTLARTTPSM